MPLTVTVNTIAECLRTDCNIVGDNNNNNNEKLKEKFGDYTRKTLDRFTTKDSYTWNIIHNTESTAV